MSQEPGLAARRTHEHTENGTMLGIIGGSGFARLADLENTRREIARTPWGDPSCALTFGELDGRPVVFLARHGYGHTIAPHEINYRANLWALRDVGVDKVVAVATVGGIDPKVQPGALVVTDQIVDYTHARKGTFFEGPDQPVTHIDFTVPYDRTLRKQLLTAASLGGVEVIDGGVYGCTQGPRLETAAEIRRLARDGCTVVGMTAMPEAALAREIELPYAALCVVANHAAGIGDSVEQVALDSIAGVLDQAMSRVRRILARAVSV
jgi:5'-methylthioinosine phosphorylase